MERRPHPGVTARPSSTATRSAATRATGSTRSTRPARPTSSASSTRPAASAKPASRRPVVQRRKGYRPPFRIPLARSPRRLRVVLVALAVVMSLCGGRLLQLQGFDPEAYASKAAERLTVSQKLYPKRGTITDRNGTVLAESQPGVTIYSDPALTTPKAAQIADVLVANLGGTPADYLPSLTRPSSVNKATSRFAYVARKIPAATFDTLSQQMTSQKLNGLFRESDSTRSYPGGTLAGPVIGAVGTDGAGLTGLELKMNATMRGTMGQEAYEGSPNGSKIPLGTQVVTPATDGTSYQLTLDAELQWMLERRLAVRQAEIGAKSGIAITMDIKTGAVLAMASTPGYDPADLGAADQNALTNRAVETAYEPGSVEKLLTFAAMVDGGYISDTTQVAVPPRLPSGGGYIKDSAPHGDLRYTARGVLAHSSNIGTVEMARGMPIDELHRYLVSFGLGQKTGIELPGESAGRLPGADMSAATRDQIAFGQGLSVTAIQEAAAISGILNGGVYNAPTIIQSATGPDGQAVALNRPDPRRVVKQSTATMLASMMEAVASRAGTAGAYNVDGYRMGSKTGTAEVYQSKLKKYYGYTTSFVSMAPAENPQIMTYVVFDRPTSNQTGGSSAGPVATDAMTFALSRFAVMPSTTKGPGGRGLTW